MDEPLDSVLEKSLAVCGARSPHDALAVALHACLLAEGFVCVATGDEVGAFYLEQCAIEGVSCCVKPCTSILHDP